MEDDVEKVFDQYPNERLRAMWDTNAKMLQNILYKHTISRERGLTHWEGGGRGRGFNPRVEFTANVNPEMEWCATKRVVEQIRCVRDLSIRPDRRLMIL